MAAGLAPAAEAAAGVAPCRRRGHGRAPAVSGPSGTL